jgi:TonB-linked SusC/RagA family outer membrane protein
MRSSSHNQTTKQSQTHPAAYRALAAFKKPLLALLMGIALSLSAYAQSVVQGTVIDEKGIAMPGVSVTIKGTTTGTQTDVNGKFSMNASTGTTLVFSMVGYNPSQVVVGNQKTISITLEPSASSLNEVVVVGYGTQKKASLTSATSSVTASEIVTTKNENLLNALSGKLPGFRNVQNTAEPGSFANNYDIRGMGGALIVIDGIPRPDLARLDPNDIESVSILKDASAAIYGVRGANGVILVTTKKGKKGELALNYVGNYGIQTPLRLSRGVGSADYLMLVNEKAVHNTGVGFKANPTYTAAQIATLSQVNTDWYDVTTKKHAGQQQHNLSATGGTDNSNYYISLGMLGQDGLLTTNDLDYKRYNLRSNISTKLSKNLTFDLNLSGSMDKKNQPLQAPYWIFRSMWFERPIYPVYANDNPAYYYALPNPLHPLAQADASTSGYQVLASKYFQSSATLTYDVPWVKGLNVKGLYSYDFTQNDNQLYNKAYNLYTYNTTTGAYVVGSVQQSPSTIRKENYQYPASLAQLSLNYAHTFGKVHNVSAFVAYEENTRSGDNFYAQRELSVPVEYLFAGTSTNAQASNSSSPGVFYNYKNTSYFGRLNYDYKSKYIAQASFRYDGSSRFNINKQWGFFPEGELGWRISEEGFFKKTKALSFISNFKLRASYGLTGDDGASTYQYLSGFTYPASGSATGQPPGSVFDGVFYNGVQSRGIANPNITWFTAKTLDAGVDMEAWNGLLGFTFDWFRRDRDGLLATQLLSLPDVVGAGLPQQNLNSDRTFGFDFSVSHRNHIGKLAYELGGTFGFTRTQNRTLVAARAGNSYLNWIQKSTATNQGNVLTGANRYNNAYFGYGSAGQFENYQAIEHSPIYVSKGTVVGDYRYADYNGDGQIGVDDSQPIGLYGLPLVSFGFNFSAAYKGVDLSAQFQGAAMVYATYIEQLHEPLWADGNALTQFLDRYHPTDPNADPYDPNTQWTPGYYAYTGTLAFVNTSANMHNASYLRLKSLEIGYTLPNKLISRSGIKSIRLFANGYNVFTITGLKYVDPEKPSGSSTFITATTQYDYAYPVDRILSFGVNLKF